MGKFLLIFTLAGDLPTVTGSYREAAFQSRQALLETSFVKEELVELQDDAEKRMYRYTGITKDQLVYGAYVYPLVTGKVSSKPFKNFKHTTENGVTLRPEIEYKFVDRESFVGLYINKEF